MPDEVAPTEEDNQNFARETAPAVITRMSNLQRSHKLGNCTPLSKTSLKTYVAKKRFCNMTPNQLIAQQLAKRLARVKRQIATLTAEAEMIERMLIDAEKPGIVPQLKLRKNSTGKWTVRGQIRRFLEQNAEPSKAQAIFGHLRTFNPSLNASTFRSHLKRMVEDGTVEPYGPRGHYQIVKRPIDNPGELKTPRPRRIISGWQV